LWPGEGRRIVRISTHYSGKPDGRGGTPSEQQREKAELRKKGRKDEKIAQEKDEVESLSGQIA